MDTEDEARDYDAMDHVEVNGRFVSDLLAFRGSVGDVLDVGTGTARIPIELCARAPGARVVAIDLAEHMLTVARENVARASGSKARIALEKRDAKSAGWPDGKFEVVMSNTILHHIPDPSDLLREMWRLTARGGAIFLWRPRPVQVPVERGARPRREVQVAGRERRPAYVVAARTRGRRRSSRRRSTPPSPSRRSRSGSAR